MVESDKNKEVILREINKKFLESLDNYRNIVTYLAGDMPLGTLCLPKNTEKILRNSGIDRIYDLFNLDLVKIEGLGETGIRDITSRINQFLAIS